jgi:cysteine desulfurase family protein (TIGR01976 family)
MLRGRLGEVTNGRPGVFHTLEPPTVEAIRSRFPAFERCQGGHPAAYFDGPGGTQVPRSVGEAMTEYLYHHMANSHWSFPTSIETDAMLATARDTMAAFVNGRTDEIVFGQNMTSLTFHLARAFGRRWKGGDAEVVITELDHGSNVAPWTAIALEHGITLRTVKMRPETGQLDWDDLEAALTPRVKLLAIHNASNVLGTITDVARATRMAHAVGAQVFVDAVHSAPHELVDVQAIDCDFLACSAYKFYGPHVGVLWGRREMIESLDPPQLSTAARVSPERMQTGTQSHESIMGAAAAVNFIASLGRGGDSQRQAIESAYDVLKERSEALFAELWSGLSSIEGVTVYGPPPGMPRTPTVSFTVAGHRTAAISAALAERGLFLSHGNFHGPTVARRLKAYDGFVRAGCSCYTTADEIDRLVDGVRIAAAEQQTK